jgi:hypothetical protein
LGPFVSNEENEMLRIWSLDSHSPYFFFPTYEWAKKTRVVGISKTFQASVMKHSSLLDLFVSYAEKGREKKRKREEKVL